MTTLDRATFEAEMTEVLRDELPEILDEIPWNDVPAQTWADGGLVPPILVRAWLSAAVIRHHLEPSDTQRAQAQLFAEAGKAELATWIPTVLDSFDAALPGLGEERLQSLRQQAEQAAALARKLGRGGTDPEERFRQLMALHGSESRSSEPYRGLRAIVAACSV